MGDVFDEAYGVWRLIAFKYTESAGLSTLQYVLSNKIFLPNVQYFRPALAWFIYIHNYIFIY